MEPGIFFSIELNSSYYRWRRRPGLVKGRGNALLKGEGDQREKQVSVENTRFRLLSKMQDNLVLVGKHRDRKKRNQREREEERLIKALYPLESGWTLYGSSQNNIQPSLTPKCS